MTEACYKQSTLELSRWYVFMSAAISNPAYKERFDF